MSTVHKLVRALPAPEPARELALGSVVFTPARDGLDAELARLEKERARLERLIFLRKRVGELRVEAALPGRQGDGLRVILAIVAGRMSCPAGKIISKDRHEIVSWPRHVVCHLARELTSLSLQRIGEALGGRDHGTVMHSVACVRDRADTDKAFRALVAVLLAECRQGLEQPAEAAP